jgi:hypothetical protein
MNKRFESRSILKLNKRRCSNIFPNYRASLRQSLFEPASSDSRLEAVRQKTGVSGSRRRGLYAP